MNPTKLALLLSLAACVDVADETVSDVEQESHSTSAAALPNNLVLARFDNAAGTSLLQWQGNRLFANRADYAATPILHHYFPNNIVQLVVGDFVVPGQRESGRDQVCARLVDNTLWCYAPSDDRSELWYWFAQVWPFSSAEQLIVGDFTGDGADDILAHNATTGGLRLFDRSSGIFKEKTFALGNLGSFDLRGKKLYAGEFGQATNRADLIVVDPVANTVARFDSVSDSSGRTTFWWAFTTASNTLAANEQVTVANLEGGTRDGLLLRNPATGALRAMRAEYGSGSLAPVPSLALSLGQLPITTHPGTLAAVKLVDHSAEPNGANRDDILFFDRNDNTIVETSARHDGVRMTYWWGWTKSTPVLQWIARSSKMAIVLCKTADNASEPAWDGLLKQQVLDRVIGVGTGSVRDFLLETSYGTIDIRNPDIYGWVKGKLTAAESNARTLDGKGKQLYDYLNDCMGAAGITSAQYEGRVYVILDGDNISSQGTNYGATMETADILNGRLMFAAHELLHAFGLGHAGDDSSCDGEYCDTSSIMGQYANTSFVNEAGNRIGPGLHAVNLDQLGVVPPSRMVDLANPTTSQTKTITLAAIEHPEAGGMLYVKVRSSGAKYYTIALRLQANYDIAIAAAGVQIHEIAAPGDPNPQTTLHTQPASALQPGQMGTAGGFSVTVNSIDLVKKTATITLVH